MSMCINLLKEMRNKFLIKLKNFSTSYLKIKKMCNNYLNELGNIYLEVSMSQIYHEDFYKFYSEIIYSL